MSKKDVFLVMGKRTPQAKSGMDLKDIQAPFLGSSLVRHIMDETGLPNDVIDEVIFGNCGTPAAFPNVGRVIALEAGLHKKTSGFTVHRNCAAGMEALATGSLRILSGEYNLVFAGGVESMSNMPLIFNKKMTNLFIDLFKARTPMAKLKALSKFRPDFLAPIIAVQQGLTDPFCNVNMGMTAEILAREFGITRLQQDEYANQSHHKAAQATRDGKFKDEILPIACGGKLNKLLSVDVGPRENSTVEGLGKMRPYFDKKSGTVTIGNSCPITDGGSAFLMASEEAVKKHNLDPIARIVDYHFHGLEPERMGMGPLVAMNGLFKKTGMALKDMDLVEINEAFSAQIIAVRKAFIDKKHAERFDVDTLWGEIPDDKLNVNGGGVALGHPVGSSGCRIVVTMAHELMKRKAQYGVASLCIGGGQGGAMIIENLKR